MRQPQRFGTRWRFQQRLALRHVDAEHGREQIRQAQRIVVGGEQPAQLLWRVRMRQRDSLCANLGERPMQRLHLRAFILGEG